MRVNSKASLRFIVAVVLASALGTAVASGQTFDSHSTGTDGALSFPNAKSGDTILFDPSTFSPPIDPEHDNIYNFTTITIPAGVTVKLSGQILGGPVYWLASGAVDIEGTLDLSGANGYAPSNLVAQRIPAVPGAGGFAGGVGGGSGDPEEPGQGPAGGQVCNGTGKNTGGSGGVTANSFLVPLIGGSGGGGSAVNGLFGAGGGAGGGAILIASSVSITINGAINASGGNAGDGYAGDGAGGSVRLAAPTIGGNGSIRVYSGVASNSTNYPGCTGRAVGLARLEAFNQLFAGSITGTQASGTPYNTFVPSAGSVPTLTVASVNGVAVAPHPVASFTNPDVTFSGSGAVPVVIKGSNIPVGTQINLQIYSENGPDIVIPNAGALAGSEANSTMTVMVNLPPGFSRGYISASFTTQPSGAATKVAAAKTK
jgi:hypothetical protein